jgi:hypothetical protein
MRLLAGAPASSTQFAVPSRVQQRCTRRCRQAAPFLPAAAGGLNLTAVRGQQFPPCPYVSEATTSAPKHIPSASTTSGMTQASRLRFGSIGCSFCTCPPSLDFSLFRRYTRCCSTNKTHFMAHIGRVKSEVISSVPMAVRLHSTPAAWNSEPESKTVLDLLNEAKRVTKTVTGFRCGKSKEKEGDFFDARHVRDEFLRLRTEAEFLRFLNQVGRFAPASARETWWGLDALRAWQQVFRDLLTHRPATWTRRVKLLGGWEQAEVVDQAMNDASTLPIQFRWHDEDFAAMIEAHDVVTAILATIFIDHLRKTKYRHCRRPDCGSMFEASRPGKVYCQQYCAHIESVRATRNRRRQELGRTPRRGRR